MAERDLILLATPRTVTKADLLKILPKGTDFLRFDLKGEFLNPGTISVILGRAEGFMQEFIDKAVREHAESNGVVAGEKGVI